MDLIDIPVPGGTAEAYVARPPATPDIGALPGVLFFMDAIGLRPQIAAMCDRIASWGYVVLAPHVFHREGTVAELAPTGDLTDPAERDAFFKVALPRIGALTSDLALADIAAYVDTLRGLDGVGAGPIGVTGYCMGARLAIRAAGAHPDVVAACGGFHGGGLVTDEADSPHLALAHARAELVLGHADNDGSMPPEAVAALGEAIAAAGLHASNEVYPGAAHGYTMADTAMWDEAAAERHYVELDGLLARTL
ncbi:dienelactone hydrolase family protein [Nocardioides psychrotolerans]|uniref:dienelactone hydrolase family protein n=1 Tax=Nocardioides psychrotolerans TaxID=1005945 RepID=UPI003137948B